jgi:hypothetical protein
VRVSVGPPRWFPEPLIEWERVYPPWSLVRAGLPEQDYRRRYRHQLHRQTPAILHELQELRDGYCAPLVLLCHCTRGFCHRRFLAEWLEGHLGAEIPEIRA